MLHYLFLINDRAGDYTDDEYRLVISSVKIINNTLTEDSVSIWCEVTSSQIVYTTCDMLPGASRKLFEIIPLL